MLPTSWTSRTWICCLGEDKTGRRARGRIPRFGRKRLIKSKVMNAFVALVARIILTGSDVINGTVKDSYKSPLQILIFVSYIAASSNFVV